MREALHSYLQAPRDLIHAALRTGGGDRFVDFEVDVDLPQRPLFPVNPIELIRARFPADGGMPMVFVMREDFPEVPHLVMGDLEFPRQLCLYERLWSDERPNWSPAEFVERIRAWLAGTADGSLHRQDQPLEPVLQGTSDRLILPELKPDESRTCWLEHFHVSPRGDKGGWRYVAFREVPPDKDTVHLPVVFVRGLTVTHGVIRKMPEDLGALDKMLEGMGASLVANLATNFGPILKDLMGLKLTREPLLLVILLPKCRTPGGNPEITEYQGFLFRQPIVELLMEETEQVLQGGVWVFEKRVRLCNPASLAKVKIDPISIGWHLDPATAAAMNGYGHVKERVVAVGVGALGSQIANNLVRGGFGTWTFIDPDRFEPHNAARHLAPANAIGFPKAEVVGQMLRTVYIEEPAPVALSCSVFATDENEPKVANALQEAVLILDFSASANVARRLARDKRSTARRISAFLNQRGDELVVLAEDAKRTIDLIWLEAEYMRAVAFDDKLTGHFDSDQAVRHRYGNGCRELSVIVAQDVVALHAGLASQTIRRFSAQAKASGTVFRLNREMGTVTPVELSLSIPIITTVGDWTVLLHPSVPDDMFRQRAEHLPSETGGVLLGLVDRESRFVAIVGLLPAPPDSKEWPTSFIRGANGLSGKVNVVKRRTLGNLVYVGEWHSHPEDCNAEPSELDKTAITLCAPSMEADGLPTLMLIGAEGGEVALAAKPLGIERLETRLILPACHPAPVT